MPSTRPTIGVAVSPMATPETMTLSATGSLDGGMFAPMLRDNAVVIGLFPRGARDRAVPPVARSRARHRRTGAGGGARRDRGAQPVRAAGGDQQNARERPRSCRVPPGRAAPRGARACQGAYRAGCDPSWQPRLPGGPKANDPPLAMFPVTFVRSRGL